mmetsp:Transcript_6902/g.11428  ORF Transcript_6902/g.11428 Transcript_6902/m.11428 type:complete len:134 (-) Transcript_6902:197-598(-)
MSTSIPKVNCFSSFAFLFVNYLVVIGLCKWHLEKKLTRRSSPSYELNVGDPFLVIRNNANIWSIVTVIDIFAIKDPVSLLVMRRPLFCDLICGLSCPVADATHVRSFGFGELPDTRGCKPVDSEHDNAKCLKR